MLHTFDIQHMDWASMEPCSEYLLSPHLYPVPDDREPLPQWARLWAGIYDPLYLMCWSLFNKLIKSMETLSTNHWPWCFPTFLNPGPGVLLFCRFWCFPLSQLNRINSLVNKPELWVWPGIENTKMCRTQVLPDWETLLLVITKFLPIRFRFIMQKRLWLNQIWHYSRSRSLIYKGNRKVFPSNFVLKTTFFR